MSDTFPSQVPNPLPTGSPLLSDDAPIMFQEFVMSESLPLAKIHQVVLRFLRTRDDLVLFGAQAVNAYVSTPRMTQGVDIMSTQGDIFSKALCEHLHQTLKIAVRIRQVASGKGSRIYQLRTPKNRHLVDVRNVDQLPPSQSIDEIPVIEPVSLIALKVISMSARPNTPKGLTDQADLIRLLLTFPDLKTPQSEVANQLNQFAVSELALQTWAMLLDQDFAPDNDDDY